MTALICAPSKNARERFAVQKVDVMELDALAGNLTNPFECLLFAVREVIDDHDFVAALQKCDNCVSANVACSTRDPEFSCYIAGSESRVPHNQRRQIKWKMGAMNRSRGRTRGQSLI